MRTTINIDNDVLAAAKELARNQNVAVGEVVSRLMRDALTGSRPEREEASPTVGGFFPFPSRGRVVTNEQVNILRDKEGV